MLSIYRIPDDLWTLVEQLWMRLVPLLHGLHGRIADVLKTHRLNSAEDLEQTLMRYVALYNHQFAQSALKSKTPMLKITSKNSWFSIKNHFSESSFGIPDLHPSKMTGILCSLCMQLQSLNFLIASQSRHR